MTNQIYPVLKSLSSPDALSLDQFCPQVGSEFNLLLEASFGPRNDAGEEVFSFEICSPEWIKRQAGKGLLVGRHKIVAEKFDLAEITAFLDNLASRCAASSWPEAAQKLGQYGHWEFEDYVP